MLETVMTIKENALNLSLNIAIFYFKSQVNSSSGLQYRIINKSSFLHATLRNLSVFVVNCVAVYGFCLNGVFKKSCQPVCFRVPRQQHASSLHLAVWLVKHGHLSFLHLYKNDAQNNCIWTPP